MSDGEPHADMGPGAPAAQRRGARCGSGAICSVFPPPPQSTYDVVHWTDMATGGHFATLEQPELLFADMRAFFEGKV